MSAATTRFEAAWAAASGVEGWLTREQVQRLAFAAQRLAPQSTVVEIGSFRGRSAIVLALSADPSCTVVAIDPHGGGDRGPGEITADADRGAADHAAFVANLTAAGVSQQVRHVRKFSSDAHSDVGGDIDLLFVDGAHRLAPARGDISGWGDRVRVGGTMLVHDAFSSVGVTLALASSTALSARWRYVGRVGSLAEFRRTQLSLLDRLSDTGRHVAQVPWFVRNLVIKVLITVKLGRLTRLLGHRGGWPY